MTRQYFQTDDGVSLPVHVNGEGPPLVILHGWTGHYQDWRPVVERLSRHFTCYGWEARPHHSERNPVIERMARDVQNLFDAFSLERPILLGHSMGALTSWEYVRQFGCGRLAALCLVDQSPKLMTGPDWSLGLWGDYGPARNEGFRQVLEENFADGVVDLIARSRYGGDGGFAVSSELLESRRNRLARMQPQPWIEAWQSFVGKDYRDVLPAIDVPVFLVYGARSAYYGPAVADYVHEHIRNSELVIYPEAGHAPQLEYLDDFERGLVAFMQRHGLVSA